MATKKINTDLQLTAKLLDTSGDAGTSDQVLVSTATGINWVDGSGSGIIGGPYLPLAGGTMTGTSGVIFPDNFKLNLGTSSDLQIYHDGSHSYIRDQGTGNLIITGSQLTFSNVPDNEYMAKMVQDGTVELYYNGSKKIETTSSGVYVTGQAQADNAIMKTYSGYAMFGSNSSTVPVAIGRDAANLDLIINASGNVGIGETNPTRALVVKHSTEQGVARFVSGSTTMGFIEVKDANTTADFKVRFGAVGNELSLWAGGGERMRIDSNGNVGIGTDNPGSELEVSASGNSAIRLTSTNNTTSTLQFADADLTNVGVIQYDHSDDSMVFRVNSSEAMRINSDGEVGIGVTNPAVPLHVDGFARLNGGLQLNTPTAQIYQIQNSALRFGTNNTERMRIDSNGNVGINETNPLARLDINQTADNQGIIIRSSTHQPEIMFVDDSTGDSFSIGHNRSGNRMDIEINGTDTHTFTEGGLVGIGTTTPATNLQVTTTSNAQGITIQRASTTAGAYGQLSFLASTSDSATPNVYLRGYRGATFDDNYLTVSTNSTERIRVLANGNVGIGETNPKAKLDVNGRFCVDSKTHLLTNAFTTCLTVNLNSHTGCYVTLTCFGDWGSHSTAAYRGEFFLQNGANAYAEPGIILRQDDNTSNGADQIVCQILDPAGTENPKDFEIQIRTTATTGTTSFVGQLTYTVQGQFNSIT